MPRSLFGARGRGAQEAEEESSRPLLSVTSDAVHYAAAARPTPATPAAPLPSLAQRLRAAQKAEAEKKAAQIDMHKHALRQVLGDSAVKGPPSGQVG